MVAPRVADPQLHGEPIELRLGQGIGPVLLDGILGGDHEERVRQHVPDVVHRDLALGHGFEQGTLGARAWCG